MEIGDGFDLDGRGGATWEDRMAALGRLADRHLEPTADLRITVLRTAGLESPEVPAERDVVVPRRRLGDRSARTAHGPTISAADVVQAIGFSDADEPFIVKRVELDADRVVAAPRTRPCRSPLIRLLHAARVARPGPRPAIRL